MIFVKQLFIFSFILFSPVQLENYKLIKADFNMGDTVFTDDVYLSNIEERKFEIKSSEGKRTFCMWDFLTMLGAFVEFDTFNSKPQVRCVFENPGVARTVFSLLNPKRDKETKYQLLSIMQIFATNAERMASSFRTGAIIGGTLYDELRNRFIVESPANLPVMIFSAGHFNVSLLSGNRIALVIQVYDIDKRDIIMSKFIIRFRAEDAAKYFHQYVTTGSPCTNSMIPIDLPSQIAP